MKIMQWLTGSNIIDSADKGLQCNCGKGSSMDPLFPAQLSNRIK